METPVEGPEGGRAQNVVMCTDLPREVSPLGARAQDSQDFFFAILEEITDLKRKIQSVPIASSHGAPLSSTQKGTWL